MARIITPASRLGIPAVPAECVAIEKDSSSALQFLPAVSVYLSGGNQPTVAGVTIRTILTSPAEALVEVSVEASNPASGNLLWYKHEFPVFLGSGDGASRWASGSGSRVRNGWQGFR